MTAQILQIRVARASIASAMDNAAISFAGMDIAVVAVLARRGRKKATGYGFHSNGRYAQCEPLRRRLAPRLLAAKPDQYADADGNLDPIKLARLAMQDEKPGGHGERAVAAGALDMALWDATAKLQDEPLWQTFSRRFNNSKANKQVFVYPGGGYYRKRAGIRELQKEIAAHRRAGFVKVKIKVGGAPPAEDLRRARAAARAAGGAENVALDANGKFSLPQAQKMTRAFAGIGKFLWHEEPVEPLDYAAHAQLAKGCPLSLATGENIFSAQDAQNLLRHGGLRPARDFLQMDPALCYGAGEYLKIINLLETHGWSRRRLIPHGGHQFGLALAAGLQLGGCESYPLIFQPYGGFANNIPVINGHVALPNAPGLGVELRPALYKELRRLLKT